MLLKTSKLMEKNPWWTKYKTIPYSQYQWQQWAVPPAPPTSPRHSLQAVLPTTRDWHRVFQRWSLRGKPSRGLSSKCCPSLLGMHENTGVAFACCCWDVCPLVLVSIIMIFTLSIFNYVAGEGGSERMVTAQVSGESLGRAAKGGSLASHKKEFKSKP